MIWRILGLIACVELFRLSTKNGLDFHVFWTAAASLWQGSSPYDLVIPVSGMVIKYPPWTLPFFLPFAVLPFPWARSLWALLSLSCIYFVLRWLETAGVKRERVYFSALLFWWLWAAHLSAGQIFLPVMVACLWAADSKKTQPIKNAIMVWAVSSKIFLSTTLLGAWEKLTQKKTIIETFWVFAFSHFILVLLYPKNLYHLYLEWLQAATSSATGLGVEVYRGQMNHGFTAGVLRHTSFDPKNNLHDIWVWFLLSIFLGYLWKKYSKKCADKEKWAGWIALGAVVHPLAWHHSFTLAYPLCALTLNQAMNSKRKKYIFSSLMGISFIALLIPQTIGLTLVTPLELVSIKSWGVCLVAATLCLIRK
jgi:hypothetical protein